MPPNLKQLVAAGVLALAGPAALAAGCPDSPLWGHLGPPAFNGADDCAIAISVAPASRDFDLTLLSFYAGTRFLTSDAAPAPFGYRLEALRRSDRGLAPLPMLSFDALGDWADAPSLPDTLALLVAGFLGVGLAVQRRRRP